MSTSFEERVSALVDDELSSFESRRMVNELVTDLPLKSRWGRYHLIGDILRDEAYCGAEDKFAAGVMDRIENEAIPRAPLINTSAWLKPVAGVAIAASVASVSLLGLKSLTTGDTLAPAQLATSDNAMSIQSVASPATVIANGMVQPVSIENPAINLIDEKVQTLEDVYSTPRMNSYLATHAEFAARPGILPRVRVVGFEPVE